MFENNQIINSLSYEEEIIRIDFTPGFYIATTLIETCVTDDKFTQTRTYETPKNPQGICSVAYDQFKMAILGEGTGVVQVITDKHIKKV